MLDGVLLGGYYTGDRNRVPIFLFSSKRMLFNYYSMDHSLHQKADKRPVTDMVQAAPKNLVFWSIEDA